MLRFLSRKGGIGTGYEFSKLPRVSNFCTGRYHGFPAAACLSMAESRGLSDFRLQWALFAQKMRADPMKSPAYEPSSSRP